MCSKFLDVDELSQFGDFFSATTVDTLVEVEDEVDMEEEVDNGDGDLDENGGDSGIDDVFEDAVSTTMSMGKLRISLTWLSLSRSSCCCCWSGTSRCANVISREVVPAAVCG